MSLLEEHAGGCQRFPSKLYWDRNLIKNYVTIVM